jgi:hypothetical protein
MSHGLRVLVVVLALMLGTVLARGQEVENLPPDCSAATPSVAVLWPANHALAVITVGGVTDPDGDDVTITVTGVAQDEPLVGAGDGDTCPDAAGVGDDETVAVRAERSGRGDGRVYHVTFAADDENGGTCTGEVHVCVPHDEGGACGDQGALVDSTGGPILCDGEPCDANACIPPAAPAECATAALPAGVARRLARASALLERAFIDEPSPKAFRQRLRAARLMERAADAAAGRAAARGTLPDGCAEALAGELHDAGTCAACLPAAE